MEGEVSMRKFYVLDRLCPRLDLANDLADRDLMGLKVSGVSKHATAFEPDFTLFSVREVGKGSRDTAGIGAACPAAG